MDTATKSAADLVKQLVTDASTDLGVEPFELGYNDLQRWCKETGKTALKEKASAIKAAGGYTAIRDAKFPRDVADNDQLLLEKVEVKKESKANKKLVELASLDQVFLSKLDAAMKQVFKGAKPSKTSIKKDDIKRKGITRELNILISDTHFGADLCKSQVLQPYGVVEETRRLAHVVRQVVTYKRDHRRETRLRVHLCGDIIQGQLHDLRDGDVLAKQCARAMYLLTRMLDVFCTEFPEVYVDCLTGNHDRFTSRHKERATYEKSDSLATVIYYGVKLATAHNKNLFFEVTEKPYATYQSFGAHCFGTHGDTVLNPGYPGSMVNVKSLETQINRINASLPNADEFKLFFCGHVHTGMVLHMGNGATLITNGSLIPSDQYSISIGLFENNCGQQMWESTEGHVVGDQRFIHVNGGVDKDSSLDLIIKPFPGL